MARDYFYLQDIKISFQYVVFHTKMLIIFETRVRNSTTQQTILSIGLSVQCEFHFCTFFHLRLWWTWSGDPNTKFKSASKAKAKTCSLKLRLLLGPGPTGAFTDILKPLWQVVQSALCPASFLAFNTVIQVTEFYEKGHWVSITVGHMWI